MNPLDPAEARRLHRPRPDNPFADRGARLAQVAADNSCGATGVTSTCRSMRSISGPEMRPM